MIIRAIKSKSAKEATEYSSNVNGKELVKIFGHNLLKKIKSLSYPILNVLHIKIRKLFIMTKSKSIILGVKIKKFAILFYKKYLKDFKIKVTDILGLLKEKAIIYNKQIKKFFSELLEKIKQKLKNF